MTRKAEVQVLPKAVTSAICAITNVWTKTDVYGDDWVLTQLATLV